MNAQIILVSGSRRRRQIHHLDGRPRLPDVWKSYGKVIKSEVFPGTLGLQA